MDVSFGTIWEAIARDLPDAVAISEPARDYTFAEWEGRAARLAAALSAAGVGPGDKVACYLYNGAPYLETVFAAFKLGAVPFNINYRYRAGEIRYLLTETRARGVIAGAEFADTVREAAAGLPDSSALGLIGTEGFGPEVTSAPRQPRRERSGGLPTCLRKSPEPSPSGTSRRSTSSP